jgi:hypothetical protein
LLEPETARHFIKFISAISMKYQSTLSPAPVQEPGEDIVREYAYHLYEQGNYAPGHEIDNWLEATACLKAHIPAHSSHRWLHQHPSEAPSLNCR